MSGMEGNSRNDDTSRPVPLRPTVVRRETDQILSYYQSELAGRSGSRQGDDDDYAYTRSASGNDSASTRSYTPSEYSSDDDGEVQTAVSVTLRAGRGGSGSAQKGVNSDRRRLAIVELDHSSPSQTQTRPSHTDRRRADTSSQSQYTFSVSSNSLQSRRGLHIRDLALVAPPDASPRSYTDLTPPPTAPIVVSRTFDKHQSPVHSRSASAVAQSDPQRHLRHKPSRDIGIVGTAGMSAVPERAAGGSTRRKEDLGGLMPPVFQTPSKSRSPSPAGQTPELSDSATSLNEPFQATPVTASGSRAPLLTPEIGEGEDIKKPVVGPVVVNLASEDAIRRPSLPNVVLGPRGQPVSPYVFYEPGVHATAGPLPPPPRSIFDADNHQPSLPPPRPPRLRTPFGTPAAIAPNVLPDIKALKESLQLPPSVHEKLASRSSSRVDLKATPEESPRIGGEYDRISITDHSERDVKRSTSTHRREGAFPPSSSSVSTTDSPVPANVAPRLVLSTQTADLDDVSSARHSTDSVPVIVSSPDDDTQSLQQSFNAPLRHQSSWVSIREGQDSAPQGHSVLTRQNTSESHYSTDSRSPPPPPSKTLKIEDKFTSNNPFRNTLSNLKRFSALPRTPSQLSMTPSSYSHQTRTPSPSYLSLPPPPKRQPQPRMRARWPRALQYADVLAKKTPLERSKAYAEKINELAQFECGLSEWVMATKYRGNGMRSSHHSVSGSILGSPRAPSSFNISPQPRHTSHGSMGSEATFPVRSDAYTATDLSMREIDNLSTTKVPPPLPYPSLVNGRINNRASMLTISSQRYEQPLSAPGGKMAGTGFFASFGRKASVKKDRGLALSPPSPQRVLTKRLPDATRSPTPRTVQLATPPSVPGGPRTVPTRMQRSQTISVSPLPLLEDVPTAAITSTEMTRRNTQRSSVSRRPSMFSSRGHSVLTTNSAAAVSDPVFEGQVDRLSDLLPHADRRILAGYLKRAGQDILAIGQYLEDEKNGSLRLE